MTLRTSDVAEADYNILKAVYDIVGLWHCGFMTLWVYDIAGLWHCRFMTLQVYDIVGL